MADRPWDSHSALVPQGFWLQGSNWQLTNGSPTYPDRQRQTALRPLESQSALAPQGSLKQGFNSQLKTKMIYFKIRFLVFIEIWFFIPLWEEQRTFLNSLDKWISFISIQTFTDSSCTTFLTISIDSTWTGQARIQSTLDERIACNCNSNEIAKFNKTETLLWFNSVFVYELFGSKIA